MLIDPGKMRHRVRVDRASAAPDRYGDEVKTWSPVGTFWAFVEPLSGRELVNARQVEALVTHRVTMRVFGPLSALDLIVFRGRTFQPTSVVRVREYGEFYEVLATERTTPVA